MKTTLELPDELMRRVKIRAAENGQKLKDTVAELIQSGFETQRRTKMRDLPTPLQLKGGFLPTAEDIEAAISWGRD